ncbi:MAG: FAD-binding oxidoreductase [Chlamydiales bacterium]|nr:FAD-binding oxidoreductase [Chlamydiales bacterium]
MTLPVQHNAALSSWGNYPVVTTNVVRPERYRDLFDLPDPYIPRGLGRSYGDAALLSGENVIVTERLDRVLSFDASTGLLQAEAGLTIDDIIKYFVPKGWFPPVTPGTKFVTLGGCIAADVHGKNHHRDGSFGAHVKELELILADGTAQRCSATQNQELFWATVGGMGLTGIISEVSLQLQPIDTAYISTRHCAARNLDEAIKLLSEESSDDKYSVAWIDCLATGKDLGRSVVILGHHAKLDMLPTATRAKPLQIKRPLQLTVPMALPFSAVNRWSVQRFNDLYYSRQSRKTEPRLVSFDPFFYPLDAIAHWNRIYGKKGFIQYQFVIPTQKAAEGLRAILDRLASSKRASFLAVLKRFGKQDQGLLSFPTEGFTLALDIAVTDSDLFPFLDQLDQLVLQYDGRVYLAKDARMKADMFRAMYPRYQEFQLIKAKVDPKNRIRSDLSQRLQIGGFR